MNNAYMGKILWVDLGTGRIQEEETDSTLYRQYLGGTGLAARILLDRIPPKTDPLGPDNIICFISGLLTGTGTLFTGRWMVAGKSPLTGTWGDANCGGNFSPAIKRCGYDGIFFLGISEKPVYLFIDKGGASLRDAAGIWGLDTRETESRLKKHAGCTHARIACIGQAGENMSLISGIANDGGRMAARSGLGAVMGSKRLKALVLCGAGRIRSHDSPAIKKLSRQCNDSIQFMPPFPPAFVLSYMGAFLRALPPKMPAPVRPAAPATPAASGAALAGSRRALLGDVAKSIESGAGILARHQAEVRRNFTSSAEPTRIVSPQPVKERMQILRDNHSGWILESE